MNDLHQGRMEKEMAGAGAPTPDAVEQRARELAAIDGRDELHPTEEDRALALRELRDGHVRTSMEGGLEEPMTTEPASHFAADTGHRVPNRQPGDPQRAMETEIREGVSEAGHDTMLKSRYEESDEKEA